MSVLQRKELDDSPLADLHAIASEIGIEGYRAMRRDDLVKAILSSQGDDGSAEESEDEPSDDDAPDAEEAPETQGEEPEQEDEKREPEPAAPEGDPVAGVLDVLPNGSGFLRADEGDDVYISPAQIRRCELRAGDEVAGPSRPARRNERPVSYTHLTLPTTPYV